MFARFDFSLGGQAGVFHCAPRLIGSTDEEIAAVVRQEIDSKRVYDLAIELSLQYQTLRQMYPEGSC